LEDEPGEGAGPNLMWEEPMDGASKKMLESIPRDKWLIQEKGISE